MEILNPKLPTGGANGNAQQRQRCIEGGTCQILAWEKISLEGALRSQWGDFYTFAFMGKGSYVMCMWTKE